MFLAYCMTGNVGTHVSNNAIHFVLYLSTLRLHILFYFYIYFDCRWPGYVCFFFVDDGLWNPLVFCFSLPFATLLVYKNCICAWAMGQLSTMLVVLTGRRLSETQFKYLHLSDFFPLGVDPSFLYSFFRRKICYWREKSGNQHEFIDNESSGDFGKTVFKDI
jgi:hypothetical protein